MCKRFIAGGGGAGGPVKDKGEGDEEAGEPSDGGAGLTLGEGEGWEEEPQIALQQ